MAARLVVLTLALALAGFAAVARHDTRTCQDRSERLLREVVGASARERDALIDELVARCRGSRLLAVSANGLTGQGPALAAHAVELADEAIRREPRNYEGWAALSAALARRGLDGAAARALAEVRRLNPRFGQGPG